ncbi:Uncharacterized protein family UPF0310 [Oleidesulfovibrio alaskensis G20]|uniref:Uncharacterized protein family UPF0310 n=1 Tax=Oleidesulfovibrio alaskensis (strain ATCC BAA-1058 / DSM 17464 / G20) TaxID=207559 RepID=Q312I8_OLEA2|nr:EVE domain-containing protein [Oleidesulfovibrio alaskensis]ABB38158.1 Uncharacterized protein family UPF0310 [Oleidesulfovibrio alaskensis G20]MBG0774444.1 EVE domain-containing protein [Oleidesulfovibrio alaskensis]
MRYWLMKSEPECFSLEDLVNAPEQTTPWDGVRNYQARNFMRDEMRPGDKVLFYHSGKNPAIAGLAEVSREAYPDHTAWDPENNHFDPRSTPEAPRWFMVDVKYIRTFSSPLPLAYLKTVPELQDMALLRKGNRLSVQPVTENEFNVIMTLAEMKS